MGWSVIVRHITLDKDLEGPDHQASLLPNELKKLVGMITEVELSLGPDEIVDRRLSQGTLLNKENLGKSIVTAKNLAKGTVLKNSDVKIMSPGSGMSPDKLKTIIGKKINVNLEKESFIYDEHFLNSEVRIETTKLPKNWGTSKATRCIGFSSKFQSPSIRIPHFLQRPRKKGLTLWIRKIERA